MKNEEKEVKKEELTDNDTEAVSGGVLKYSEYFLSKKPPKGTVHPPQIQTQRQCQFSGCKTTFFPTSDDDIYCKFHKDMKNPNKGIK